MSEVHRSCPAFGLFGAALVQVIRVDFDVVHFGNRHDDAFAAVESNLLYRHRGFQLQESITEIGDRE